MSRSKKFDTIWTIVVY